MYIILKFILIIDFEFYSTVIRKDNIIWLHFFLQGNFYVSIISEKERDSDSHICWQIGKLVWTH